MVGERLQGVDRVVGDVRSQVDGEWNRYQEVKWCRGQMSGSQAWWDEAGISGTSGAGGGARGFRHNVGGGEEEAGSARMEGRWTRYTW